MRAAAVYDPVDHRLVVFGGRASGRELGDVWTFDLAARQWSELAPAAGPTPAPRSTHNAVYDAQNHRVLIWSGRQNSTFFNDVWAFDLASDTWTELTPPEPVPNVRYGTAAVFDPVAQDLVTFAGFTDQGRFEDTWRFDAENDTWTEVTPAPNPGKRCLHAASYDVLNHRMIMYGGQRGGGALGDIWAFDLAADTWTELTPPDSPPGRFFAASAYDARSHRFLVFGGNLGADNKTSEVWVFDLSANTWEELAVSGSPPAARDGGAAAYVAAEDRVIVFGGAAVEGLFNDVWSLEDLAPDAPTLVESAGILPSGFVLHQNHPNPFNPSTTIPYDLPQATQVALKVYDLLGQKVRTLVQQTQGPGPHSVVWDGKDDQENQVGSGAYLYRLQAGPFVATRKLSLIR